MGHTTTHRICTIMTTSMHKTSGRLPSGVSVFSADLTTDKQNEDPVTDHVEDTEDPVEDTEDPVEDTEDPVEDHDGADKGNSESSDKKRKVASKDGGKPKKKRKAKTQPEPSPQDEGDADAADARVEEDGQGGEIENEGECETSSKKSGAVDVDKTIAKLFSAVKSVVECQLKLKNIRKSPEVITTMADRYQKLILEDIETAVHRCQKNNRKTIMTYDLN